MSNVFNFNDALIGKLERELFSWITPPQELAEREDNRREIRKALMKGMTPDEMRRRNKAALDRMRKEADENS